MIWLWSGTQAIRAAYLRLEPRLPAAVRMAVSRAATYSRVMRLRPLPTRLLGPEYRRSRTRIELNLTYACNLKCFNCNRSCEQAPSGAQMTLRQVEGFIAESVAARHRWKTIVLIGGEPTIHKDFLTILQLLREYRREHSPDTKIEVFTNGFGEKVTGVVAQIPDDVIVINSSKGKAQQVPYHISFNLAPVDCEEYRGADFRNGCWIAQKCGMGMGPSGYYPCGVAPGIDRIFGWNLGRQSLPEDGDDMQDLLNRFCRQCGHFKRIQRSLQGRAVSETWENAYAAYRRQQPHLTSYGSIVPEGTD